MPVWFNTHQSAPTDRNDWVTQWSFFAPNPADWNRASAGVVVYTLSPMGPPQELHPGHSVPEILFVFAGEGILQEGESREVIKEGDAIFIAAEQPHLIWTTSADPTLALVAFRIMPGMGELRDSIGNMTPKAKSDSH